jgi:hypothetical protein
VWPARMAQLTRMAQQSARPQEVSGGGLCPDR